MTIERIVEIRNAVKVLASLSDSEWAEVFKAMDTAADGKHEEVVQNSVKDQKSIQKRLYEIFKEIGVPSNIKGYKYLQKAVLLVIEDPGMLESVTKELYPAVAEEYETTTSRVERAIRHAIESACNIGNTDKIEEIFGPMYSFRKAKPENSKFIAGIVEYLSYN